MNEQDRTLAAPEAQQVAMEPNINGKPQLDEQTLARERKMIQLDLLRSAHSAITHGLHNAGH